VGELLLLLALLKMSGVVSLKKLSKIADFLQKSMEGDKLIKLFARLAKISRWVRKTENDVMQNLASKYNCTRLAITQFSFLGMSLQP
jgi:hypothetical protein